MICHYMGCAFNFIAQIEINFGKENTWLHFHEIIDDSIGEKYLDSVYFSFITMTTIGYGDFYPQTALEKIFVILISLIACGIFGYSMNIIGRIF